MAHINHLTDNLEFTIEDIIRIFDEILSGNLKFTEKFDGMQIYFGILPNGDITLARNKSDLREGGRDLQFFKQKYSSKDKRIYQNYKKAYQKFANAIYKLIPKEDFIKMVPENSIFYINCEILNPDFSNVITYDKFSIIIHKTGHKCLGNYEYFMRFLMFLKEKINEGGDIFFNRAIKLKNSSKTKRILNDLTQDIRLLCQEYDVTPEDQLSTFLYKSITQQLKNSSAVDSSVRNLIARKMVGYDIEIAKIVSLIDNYDVNTEIYINDLLQDKEKTKKKALYPLDNIISTYSNQIFKLLGKSQLVSEPGQDNGLKVPIEGIVFNVGDDLYKLTGNFSRVNREKWKKKRINESIDEEMLDEEQKTNAYMVGGFKPPHLGHYNILKSLQERQDINKIYIFISNSPRMSQNGKITIADEGFTILKELFSPEFDKIEIFNVGDENPVIKCCDFINKKEPTNHTIEIIEGKEDRLMDVFNKYTRLDIEIIPTEVPLTLYSGRSDKLNGQPVCGTIIRNDLANNDKINFITGMPKICHNKVFEYLKNRNNIINEHERRKKMDEKKIKDVAIKEVKKIVGDKKCLYTHDGKKKIGCVPKGDKKRWEAFMAAVHANESIDVKRYLKNLKITFRKGKGKNSQPFDIKPEIKRGKSAPPIEEESSMASGAISGSSSKPNKKRLRNLIIQEIEKILSEKASPVIHKSTGINVLEELLKKILPKMERSYKTLTTSQEQRKIWKKYVLQGMENIIIPNEKISDMADEDFEVIRDPDAGMSNTSIFQTKRKLNPMLENVELKVDIEKDDSEIIGKNKEDKYIPIDAEELRKNKDLTDKDIFREEEDENDNTGKRIAMNLIKEVEKQVLDAYNLLDNEKDKQYFYDFLLTNIDLYTEKWEEEIE